MPRRSCSRTVKSSSVNPVGSGSGPKSRRAWRAAWLRWNACACSTVTPAILGAASQPLPTVLGTLDAIHLATAVLWRESRDPDLVIATHDRALALAARASGFRVIGV